MPDFTLSDNLRQSLSVRNTPLPDLIETAWGAQAVNRTSVASLAFLLYDICLTFDEEVHLFWQCKWTLVKFNFFFIRYVPLLVQIPLLLVGTELTPKLHFTDHDCFVWQVYQGVASFCVVISCDFILLSRIRALYFHSPYICNLIYACYSLEIVSMLVGLALDLRGIRYDKNCTVVSVPLGLLVYGGGIIFFQTLLFALTAYKFFRGLREGWGEIPTVSLIMRDGTWAFCLLFVVAVGEASLYSLKNHAFAGILYAWMLTLYSFCGYRVLLNISHLSHSPPSRGIRTLTTMGFGISRSATGKTDA
ncbi:hypothetical protein PM082_016667 [Marasmius tenuissimus]|nr:hypothetical protein PM082_016667 [Marasmius tenuissimus]